MPHVRGTDALRRMIDGLDEEFLDGAVKTIRAGALAFAKGDGAWAQAFIRGCDAYTERNDGEELGLLMQLKRYPVDVEEFIFGVKYLNKRREEIYPAVLEELRKINNPRGMRVLNPWTEAVFTGGIGSAKSTTALYTVAYQLYVLSCFRDPHATFGMDRATEILFAFQSASGGLAKSVDYDRFYEMVAPSHYFRVVFPYNPRIKSELQFPHRIQVKAIGADLGTLGQNVIGGLIDELNFMQIVQESKREIEGRVYDQAEKVYNSISRRRKSRFVSQGKMPGILCLVSSKRYPGEFTDRKVEEARTDPSIYVYDKRVWEIKPPGHFCGKTFRVFVGSMTKKARVLEADEVWEDTEAHLVLGVPVEYELDFKRDLVGAIRDIAGVSILARFPFFSYTEAVSACFVGGESVLNFEESDLLTTILQFFPKRFRHPARKRWVHIDLGLTGDSAGVACGYVEGFADTEDGFKMPVISVDFVLRVTPPRNGEIQFEKIRTLLVKLRENGLPIKWVSFDSFQSVDSIQILRQKGFTTGQTSMDKTVLPYAVTKTCMYQGRLHGHPHPTCMREFLQLEQDAKTGKIDHPPAGSKDCSDALAGVVYGLSTRKEIYAEFGVPIRGVLAAMKAVDVREDERRAEHAPEVAPSQESETDRVRRFKEVAAAAKMREKVEGMKAPPTHAHRRDRT